MVALRHLVARVVEEQGEQGEVATSAPLLLKMGEEQGE